MPALRPDPLLIKVIAERTIGADPPVRKQVTFAAR